MAGSFQALKDLELSRDEVERLGTALKDKEFRKLLCEYVDEIQDPENQKVYQQEITQLEKDRGYDVTFINPIAGYVIKTSVNGSKKAFVNVCANENIRKPTSSPMMQDGTRGLQWNLPHSLTPPREDVDKKGVRCEVYDVVFHPDTLYLAKNSKPFSNMVNKTACEAVENSFNIKLDCKNLKFPKMQYKGMSHPSIIRKPSQTPPEKLEPEEQVIMDQVFASLPKASEQKAPKSFKVKNHENFSKYTTPAFIIKHRTNIEFEEFIDHKNAKLNTTIPKEIVVEVNLPLLKSADDMILDVTEKTIQLISEKPSKYKLHLTLPHPVNQDAGNAKFEKDTKKLIVTLPVKRKGAFIDVCRDDSGVDSDHGSPLTSSPTEELFNQDLITVISETSTSDNESDFRTNVNAFLDPDTHYTLPDHNSHVFENILAITLLVKNVDETSLKRKIHANSIHVTFSTISSGFYPVHYAFYAQIQDQILDEDKITVEIWDNNVIMQLPFLPCDKLIHSYTIGVDDSNLVETFIDEPVILNNKYESRRKEKFDSKNEKEEDDDKEDDSKEDSDKEDAPKSNPKSKKSARRSKNVHVEKVKINEDENKPISRAIDIAGAGSESSGDELSSGSCSPSKCKGILKRFSTSCSSVSRSISESSIDDVFWASSFENCYTSLDSVIPEDGEISSSFKKTVRFNDVVLKQLYRSNSSILGQKKKNQRKSRNKKRAQERRHSESELSELEERKERDLKTMEIGSDNYSANQKSQEESKGNDIFELDI